MNKRELFKACGGFDVPDSVAVLSAIAGDNAADVVGWDNRHDANGQKTDAFLDHWFGSIQDLLSTSTCDQAARAWFESRNIWY